MKIWVVLEHWSIDGDGGSNIWLYSSLQGARAAMSNLINSELTEGVPSYRLDKNSSPREGYICNNSDDSWEFYKDGYYEVEHTSIGITEHEILH